MNKQVRRIIIADDHEAIREGVRGLLSVRPQWEIVGVAANGRDALQMTLELQPDIVILDYSLPQINGLELTAAIKRGSPLTEILIYTMHDREELLVDIFKAGARGYVFKADPGRNLIAAVDALSLRRPYFSSEISEILLHHFVDTAKAVGNASTLTAREREIVQMIAEGSINKKIAHTLGISVKTVETHRSQAMHKLKLRSTAELVRYAVRNNIVEA